MIRSEKRSFIMREIQIIFLSLLLSACTSMVNVDYDHNTNFRSLKTYHLVSKPIRISNDTRVNSPFMQQRVLSELDAALSAKGFISLESKADFIVKYYLDIKPETETVDSGVSVGFGSFSRHSAVGFDLMVPIGETSRIDKLVLTIDIVANKSDELLWRGSLGYSLYQGSTPETYNKLINELVVEILKTFPPN